MSYIRDPIYMTLEKEDALEEDETGYVVRCYECGGKAVGRTDEDAYIHMMWHKILFEKQHRRHEARIVELTIKMNMIDDVLREKGVLTRDDYAVIVGKMIGWSEAMKEEML